MEIVAATREDIDTAVNCWATAFGQDPITGYLLQTGPGYHERVSQFFRLLMRARIELGMPVLVARDADGIRGGIMGYNTERPAWPADITREWDQFEHSIPGMIERMAVYEGIAADGKPTAPHYYLGVIGVDPAVQGQGVGKQLIQAFCALSTKDTLSKGVYLETAKASSVPFYERAGFVETKRADMGGGTLWCMFQSHGEP